MGKENALVIDIIECKLKLKEKRKRKKKKEKEKIYTFFYNINKVDINFFFE